MLLREGAEGSYLESRKTGVRDWLAIRLRSTRLDRELAAGRSPDASVRLALRARVLGRPSTRAALAHRLRDVIVEAQREGPRLRTTRMPVCRRKVRLARPELEALADRLMVAGPVSPEGVALARQLVHDGSGPVHTRPQADDLAIAADLARRALDAWRREPDELDDLDDW